MNQKLLVFGGAAAVLAVVLIWMWGPESVSEIDYLAGGKNLICFGDSLTFGTGAPETMSYPAQLSRKLKRPVVNAGVPGDTTASALSRLQRDVLERSPGIVLITLGGNDLKNRIPADIAFENLQIVVERIQKTGALVVLGGISIPFWDRGFSKRYRTLAEETGAVLVENVYEGIMGNRSKMSDTIHPNADGYRIMAEHFAEALRPYLEGS
jgi:lysophospholipase L1-like esterase